ncbi:MAG: hypothetical protein R3F33_07245 [Planctomycetota bacterium]
MILRLWLLLLLVACGFGQGDEILARTSIGMRLVLRDVVLPVEGLEPVPVHDAGKADALVRILESERHGEAMRYTFEVTPYVAGAFDLRTHLQGPAGASVELPPLNIEVSAVLPPGRMEPAALEETTGRRFGGYKNRMILAGILWIIGLIMILYLGRQTKRRAERAENAPPPTVAQLLRPLLEKAHAGDLPDRERADLERLLLRFWRDRRGLAEVSPVAALARLKQDKEAGPLLVTLETWLHSPGPAPEPDWAALLAPYQKPAQGGLA